MALVSPSLATSRAEEMALRLIVWAGLTPPIDVEGAARRLGIDIEELELSKTVAGMLVREEPGRWLIIVNKRIRHEGRRRFTIAHELGHWVLHRPQMKLSSLGLAERWEREANQFASHLLLPEDLVREYVRRCGYRSLAMHFRVSEEAAYLTLRRMGYR